MKKFAICTAILCLLLTGCVTKPQSGSAAGVAALPALGGEMRLLADFRTYNVPGGSGPYQLEDFSGDGGNILYVDYPTQSLIYLCNRPECSHKDETCTSWLGPRGGTLAFDREKLYVLGWHTGDETASDWAILQMNPDGSGRRTVQTFPASQSILNGVVSDGTNFYFFLSEVSQDLRDYKKYLCALHLETGNLFRLQQFAIDRSIFLAGGAGQNLLLMEHRRDSDSEKTGEEGWQENHQNTQTVYSSFSLKRGEQTELLRHPLAGRTQTQKGETLYYIDHTDAALKAQNLLDQSSKTIASGLALNDHINILGIWGNRLLYSLDFPAENGALDSKYYGVDLTNGSVAQLTLLYSDGIHNPGLMKISAEFENHFLLKTNEKNGQKTVYYEDGNAEIKTFWYPEYAFIAKEDYWNGVANYIPISDQVFG